MSARMAFWLPSTILRKGGEQLARQVATQRRFLSTERTLTLTVANPARILNNIALRYQSAPRILMEYIDNGIDDAEESFRKHNKYPRRVEISVVIDKSRDEITITDNGHGMNAKALEDCVLSTGESKKKGVPWLNGQFGFGIHAFRAACRTLQITSKTAHSHAHEIVIPRDQSTGIKPPYPVDRKMETSTGTGTQVVLKGFDAEWARELSGRSVTQEIEYHFERLLSRPNLHVAVTEIEPNKEVYQSVCKPHDYDKIGGHEISDKFDIGGHPVTVRLKVAPREITDRQARFFSLGRRINEVASVSSFMKHSKLKQRLWAHPQLVGYVDVTDVLETVITRDEFKNTANRRDLYDRLLTLEPKIMKAIDKEMEKQRVVAMARMEGLLSSVLDRVVKEERREHSRQLRAEVNETQEIAQDIQAAIKYQQEVTETKAERQKDEAPQKDAVKKEDAPKAEEKPPKPEPEHLFDIRFVHSPKDDLGHVKRSFMSSNIIYINTAHPDFVVRAGGNASIMPSKPKFNDRLSAYLSSIVALHYKDRYFSEMKENPPREQLFNEFMNIATRFESVVRRRLPALQRSLDEHMAENT